MNPAEQVDLLDLELSHEADDDVSKPVSNDGMQLFNYDHETQPMLGTKSTESLEMGSIGNNLSQSPTTAAGEAVDPSTAKCWSIQYYQPWFDIDTNQELHRLKKSLLPFLSANFFDKDLDEEPDLLRCCTFSGFGYFAQIRLLFCSLFSLYFRLQGFWWIFIILSISSYFDGEQIWSLLDHDDIGLSDGGDGELCVLHQHCRGERGSMERGHYAHF